MALDALGGDGDDLAVLDLAHELGADDVERAGLRGQHVGAAEPAQHQRADADGIARADQHVVGEADERIGALDLPQRLDEALDDAAALRAGHQVQDDLGVGGRLADGAGGDQLAPQRQRVGEVAVVGDGEAAGVEVGEQRLHVAQDGVAGGGVAVVAEGDVALEAADDVGLVEVVADEAEAALGMEMVAVEGDDAGGLLAAMLQGVQPERGQRGGVLVAEDAEDAALLAQAIVVVGPQRCSPRASASSRANRPWRPPAPLEQPAPTAGRTQLRRLTVPAPQAPLRYRATRARLPPRASPCYSRRTNRGLAVARRSLRGRRHLARLQQNCAAMIAGRL